MKTNVRAIKGNWDQGLVLDKHTLSSTFLGHNDHGRAMFDTTRSEVGEALFRLKYRNDWSRVAPLGKVLAQASKKQFGAIGFVVPMPPSTVRARQPVFELADAVATELEVPMFNDMLLKSPAAAGSPPLKNLTSKEEKVAALEGRMILAETITNEGSWNALIVDDLFESGASMEAACRTLRPYKKIKHLYVAALTWS